MSWPSYRERYLPAMSAARLRAVAGRDAAIVILPTGAVEQHGPQLPVAVDAYLGQVYLDLALPLLPEEAPVYVAPPVQAGKSNEHDGFPGTLVLSRESLRRLVLAAGRQIAEWGFSRIAILNTHGGNLSVLKSALRELAMESGLGVSFLNSGFTPELWEREAAFGIHANEVESSLMYAAAPSLVAPEAATCRWVGSLEDPGQMKLEFAPAIYAWKSLDLGASGTMGDATAATEAKGRQWLQATAEGLAKQLLAMVQ